MEQNHNRPRGLVFFRYSLVLNRDSVSRVCLPTNRCPGVGNLFGIAFRSHHPVQVSASARYPGRLMRIGQRAPPVAGVCVIGFREACAGFDGNHAATETRRPGVDDVDAPAAAGLCRSVGHEPLIAPPAGFERSGNPLIFRIRAAAEAGMGVVPEAHRPTRRRSSPEAFREGRDGTLGRAVQFGGDSAQVCPRPDLIVDAIGHGLRDPCRDAAARDSQAVSREPKSLYPTVANIFRLCCGR